MEENKEEEGKLKIDYGEFEYICIRMEQRIWQFFKNFWNEKLKKSKTEGNIE